VASTGLVCVYRSDVQYLEAGSANNFFIRIFVLASRGAEFIEDCISLSLQTARQMFHVAPQLKCECSVPILYTGGSTPETEKWRHRFLDLPVCK